MFKPSKDNDNHGGVIDRAKAKLLQVQGQARELGIVDFIKTIVDAFNVDLFLSQRVLLKGIYAEDLDDEEQALMDEWVRSQRTNWKHPLSCLHEKNMARAVEGKGLVDDFRYQMITVQAGMRCLRGDTLVRVKGLGLQRIDSLLPAAGYIPAETELELEVWTRHGFRRAIKGYAYPAQRVINLRTRSGYETGGSSEHPLMTVDAAGNEKWKTLAEIRVGDLLLVDHGFYTRCEPDIEAEPVLEMWESLEPVYDIEVPGRHEFLADGFVSSNSTKSATMALIAVYEFFKAICHPCIQDELGIPRSSPLYITAVASTHQQALGTIFWYIHNYITGSTFFKTLIDSGEIVVREGEIEHVKKSIIIASGHSKATNFVGRTALLVLFDELAMFSSDESGTSNAAEVYDRIGRSTATARKHGKIIALSSVKCTGDYMETLVRNDWERQVDGCLVFDLSTFDMNPMLTKEEPTIKAAYVKDPVTAERDFENIRPGASSAFLIPAVIATACMGRDPQVSCKYSAIPIFRKRGEAVALGVDDEDDGETIREMSGLQVAVEPVPSKMYRSIGHCDPGVVRDSFAFGCGHAEVIPDLGIATIIDVLLEWIPRPLGKNRVAKVDLINVEEVIIDVAKKRNMTELTFDHWNCLAPGSWVSTIDGLCKVEELLPGQQVLGRLGRINQVVATERVSNVLGFKIATKFGYELTCTRNHPLLRDNKWVEAEDLAVGDTIELALGNLPQGEEDSVAGLVYGYLVAEGNWYSGRGGYIVCFSNTEVEVQDDYVAAFESVFSIQPKLHAKKALRCCNKRVYTKVADVVATGAFNKHVPEFVMKGGWRTARNFLAGLYEGDGNVRENKQVQSVELNTVSETLSKEVQILLASLGIKCSRKYFTNKFFNGVQRPFYRLTIYGENIIRFQEVVGFRSTRKREALARVVQSLPNSRRSRSADPYDTIVSIEPVITDIVHMEVSGDHSYHANGFMNHNSAGSIQRLWTENIQTSEMHFGAGLQKRMYENFRNRLNQGLIKFPHHPTLIEELENLELRGDRVDHPKKKDSAIPGRGKISKDLADVVAAIDWQLSRHERDFIRGRAHNPVPGMGGGGVITLGQPRRTVNAPFRR